VDLSGPNARVWSDLNDDDTTGPSPASEAVAPGAYTFRDFTPTFDPTTPDNGGGQCAASARCSWNVELLPPEDDPPSFELNRAQNAVQAFWFVNRIHDRLEAAPIGFSEFEGTSRLRVHTDDGAGLLTTGPDADGVPPTDPGELETPEDRHTDNANMFTPPSGSPTMQLYLFYFDGGNSPFRDVNGGDDAAIVYHEYTHGLSDRLVTRAANSLIALGSAQGGAMGEGWSDWYAKDFLVDEFPAEDTPAPGEVHMGDYVDAIPNSIRSQALDCPVGAPAGVCENPGFAGAGGYTYGDFGRIALNGAGTAPRAEVHADGEIWAQTLWDLRDALGSEVARAIVTQGMRLVTTPPTFLSMRDAIMLADQGIYGGAHADTLWRVFAARGMGFDASTTGPGNTTPKEDFHAGPNQLPTGTLSASPSSPLVGQEVQLTAAMTDPDGQIVGYDWDFNGDGTTDGITTEATASIAYSTPGTFTPRVDVRDSRKGTARFTTTVTVRAATQPPPPPASLLPKLTLAGTGRRFAVRYVAECDSRCTGTATLTISRRLAKRLKLRSRRVGTVRFTLPAAGKRTASLTLSFKARRAMRRAKLRRIAATFAVVATDAEAQRATARRSVRISSR
jgi:PKD repeat protein